MDSSQTPPTSTMDKMMVARNVAPDFTGAENMSKAMDEMRSCLDIFTAWSNEAYRLSSGRKPIDPDIVLAVDNLRRDAERAVQSSSLILQSYTAFARSMERLLEKTSLATFGRFEIPQEVLDTASRIASHSDELSRHARSMQAQLGDLMKLVVDRKKSKKKNVWQRVKEWLLNGFKAFANVFGRGGSGFVAPIPGIDPPLATVANALGNGKGLGYYSKSTAGKSTKELDTAEDILHFMQYHIPDGVQKAEEALTSFQHYHLLMQSNNDRLQGARARMAPIEARKARAEWQQYMLRLAPQAGDVPVGQL